MLDKTIFVQNMAGLCEVYDKSLTKTLQNIYYAILKDMQDEDFKQAIKRLLQERVFATFPKPAEILSLSNVKKIVTEKVDEVEQKAKELIELVHSMNNQVYADAKRMGTQFEDLLKLVKFPQVNDDDIAILNQVKPHNDLKQLISNIYTYQTGLEQLKAFKNAVNYSGTYAGAIENNKVKTALSHMKHKKG